MGFSQALSGLGAAQKQLDVVGNNISNSQTAGFKSSSVQFADVFAGQTGLGTRVVGELQDFSSGSLEASGRNLDLAIAGTGFYRFEQEGQVGYSRNGQLTMTANGDLINGQGAKLMGYGLADANDPFSEVIPGGKVSALNIPAADMPASATTKVGATYNLDASIDPDNVSAKSTVELQAVDEEGVLVTVDANGNYDTDGNPTKVELKYNYSNSYTVYDSLGNARNVTNYFEKVDENQWKVTTAFDGKLSFTGKVADENVSDLQNSHWLKFNENGQLATYGELDPDATTNVQNRDMEEVAGVVAAGFTLTLGSTSTLIENNNAVTGYSLGEAYQEGNIEDATIARSSSTISFPVDGGAQSALVYDADFAGTTQFANNSTSNTLTQNGYTSGSLVGISIEDDGTIMRNFTNEKSVAAGQVVLANFRNPEGLSPIGDNLWAATDVSGVETIGIAGTGQLGSIESGMLEASNVDLTTELVDLIIAQRAYQANTNSIRTQSEAMEAVAQLR